MSVIAISAEPVLLPDSTHFIWEHETHMHGGNRHWADPQEANDIGVTVGVELIDRHQADARPTTIESPQVPDFAAGVLLDALDVVNYAALPTERRANILHGVIDAMAANGALGGKPEWAKIGKNGAEA